MLLGLLTLLGASGVASAQKTDVLVMRNGDSLTVEIKSLERGKLQVKTHGLGTLQIEWPKVARLESDKVFRIEVASGLDWFGSLLASGRDGEVLMKREQGTLRLSMDNIVSIAAINKTFLGRTSGHVDVGFNFARATRITQLNLGFGVTYEAPKYSLGATGSSNLTRQPDVESKQRNQLELNYRHYWRPRWFVQGSGGLQQNDELGLRLRTYAALGVGRKVLRSQSNSLHLLAGLFVSEESSTGVGQKQGNVEGIFSLEYQVFKFDAPELDIAATAALMPSFTVSGRVRSNANLRLRWSLISDFDWTLTTYLSSDNKPLNGNAATMDYGVISGISYSL